MIKTALVLPVYNEGSRIGEVLKGFVDVKMPIFIVDDGSTDSTNNLINSFLSKSKDINLLTHKINLGKGAALKTGCEAAFSQDTDVVIMMDSDGQHNLSDLDNFIKKINLEKYDIFFGSRNLTLNAPLVRLLGNKAASILVSVMFGIYVSDLLCGFRAITKKAYQKINWESKGYGVETEMVVKTARFKLNFCEVPIQSVYHDRNKGVTILDALGILFDVFRWRINI